MSSVAREPILSVIVPVYQDWDDALLLLACLSSQTLPPCNWQAILVDNGSDWIPDLSDWSHFVTIISCDTPGSYAARNRALSLARGQYMVFTDADCRPESDWLANIHKRILADDHPNLVAGNVVVDKLTPGKANRYELYDMALGLPQERYVSRGYAVTANLTVDREVFESVGLFDERRFSGGDAEFCQRAIGAGFRLVYEATATVYHPARSEWALVERKARRIKGGQIRNGPLKRRSKFFIRTFLPPVFAFWFTLRSPRLSPGGKLSVCLILCRLWMVEMTEVCRLLAGSVPERR